MLEAPTFDHVLAHRNRKDGAACCILLAPRFTKVGQEDVIPRLGYLDHRSAEHVHFYCAGYGGYGNHQIVPDMEEIGPVKYANGVVIPWWFSQRLFGGFVDDFERATSWKYSGDAELVMLGPEVNFSQSLIFYFREMIRDGAIASSAELFEAIIQYSRGAKGNPSAYDFSDVQGSRELGKGALHAVLSVLPKPARGIWEKGRHYAVRDIHA